MNTSIQKLSDTASKSSKRVIGLMSGTSLDGLDIALCEICGCGNATVISLNKFETVSYNHQTKKRLQVITSVSQAAMEEVCLLHSWLGNYQGKLVLEAP